MLRLNRSHIEGVQTHRAHLQFRLQRLLIDRIAGHRVDRDIVAVFVVPVKRRKTRPRADPVGDDGGQHGAAAPRRHLHGLAVDDVEGCGVSGMDLNERSVVQASELGDPAGLGHGVPLVRQPTGVEHQRKFVVGAFVRFHVRPGVEHGAARRGGERQYPVVEVADRVATLDVAGGARPLHRRLPQPLIADAANVVAGLGICEPTDLVEDLFTGPIVEVRTKPHCGGDLADQLPIGPRLSGRRNTTLHQRQVALGVDHHTVGLRPQRRRQHHVGIAVGGGIGVGVLRDDEFSRLEPGDHAGAVGHGGHRIGADDPAGLDVARGHLRKHVDGAAIHLGADRARFQAPHRLDERPVRGRDHGALTGQSGPHVTHFAPAHRVGLAGQRQRAATRPADGAGSEVQVADGVGVPGAVGALVQPHCPQRHPLAGLSDHRCRGADIDLGQTGEFGDPRRRIVGEEFRHRRPALGVRRDEIGVDIAGFHQQMQQTVQQRKIGAGPELKVQVGLLRGCGAPRVDDYQLGAGPQPVGHPQEQDRMAVGHIGADDEEQVSAIDVVVGARRPVSTERLFVSRCRAGHAQPRVRFDVDGADETLGQFRREILGLERHLAGHVQGDRVRAVAIRDVGKPGAHGRDGVIDGRGVEFLSAGGTNQGIHRAALGVAHQLGVCGALRAQPAAVGGMKPVTDDTGDDRTSEAGFGAHLDATPDTAIRACGADVVSAVISDTHGARLPRAHYGRCRDALSRQ